MKIDRKKWLYSDFKQKQIPLQVEDSLRVSRAGFEYGLSVVLNQRVNDYCHTFQDLIGTNIYLLDSTVYLDEMCGDVAARVTQPNEELFMSVDAFVVTGSEHMRSYKPYLRQCFFPDETALDKYRLSL